MFWFDRDDPRALFVDRRRETHPIDIGTPGTIGRALGNALVPILPQIIAEAILETEKQA